MRHLRLRQLVRYLEGGATKNYRKVVAWEKKEFAEDWINMPTTIEVRNMHVTLGSWDKSVEWMRWKLTWGLYNHLVKLDENRWSIWEVHPKDCYKHRLKDWRWKEQERRTEEFFNSMEV